MANIYHEYANFSKAARIILELNTKVLREYLTTVTPPASLPQSIINLKVLNQSQKAIVQNIFNILSYEECDSSLLYILIRNYCNIRPASGWCKPVNPSDTNIGDDVERMRVLRNDMHGHAKAARLPNGDYNWFIQDVRRIMIRFDTCHGGTYQKCFSTGTFESELNKINTSPMDPVLQKHYNTLFIDVSKVKTDLVTLDNKVDAIGKDYEDHDTIILNLEKNFTDCETDLKSHDDKIICLENAFGTQEEKLDSLTKDVAILKKVIPTNSTFGTAHIPHEHDLEYLYRMNWVCKKCGVCSKNEKSFYCVLCDYDECTVCAGNQQKQSTRCTNAKDPLGDNDSPHSHFVNGTWSITAHHSQDDGPINVLRNFNREKFISKGEKNQRLYESGCINYYSEEEFDKELEKKFLSTFSPEYENQPWLMNNMHTDCDVSNNFNDICDILRCWSISAPYSFLIINYSLEDHAKKLSINLNKLKKDLKIYEDEDESKRILLYRGDIETLFIIRCTESTSKEDICNEVIKAQNDVKLFSTLHINTLTKSNISIVSMVVTSNLKDIELSALDICKECIKESLIVSKDTITTHLGYIKRRRSGINKQGDNMMRKKSTFLSLASRIIGYISIADVHLPNISGDGAELSSRIYLNKTQRDFVRSKRKHSILQGGFGSGKTILAQLRFKQIIQTADPDDSIYLIVHSNETLLRNLIQLMVDGIPNKQLKNDHIFVMNANEYCEKFGLIAPLMVSDILQDMTERHANLSGRPHLIIDELEGSNITENEGKTIKECLEKLLDSFILLVTHSLEVFRKKVTTKYYLLTEKEYYNGFHYLATGMKIIVLDHIMRNTTGINVLARSAIRTLKGSVTVFQERQLDSSMLTTTRTRDSKEVDEHDNITSNEEINIGTHEKQSSINSIEHDTNDDTSSLNDGNVKVTRGSGTNWKQIAAINHFSALIDQDKEIALANIKLDEDLSLKISPNTAKHEYLKANDIRKDVIIDANSAGTTTQNIRKKSVREVSTNMDHVLKQIGDIPGKKSGNKIISKFNFPGAWDNGHGVKGKIPVLYYPFEDEYLNYDNVNDPETRGRLCYVLRNIDTPKSPIIGMGVICFEIIDSLLFYEVLKALGCPVILYTPAMDADTKPMDIPHIRDILKTHVIITDHIGSRGLEFQKLILCVNPNETFLHQYILEGMTRCIYDLHVIVINKESKGSTKNITCGKIIKNWIKAGLVKKQVITVCIENHNEDDDDVSLVKVMCKEIEGKHFIHPLHNNLKVPLVPIKKVTIDFGRCFDMYNAELSNTQHIDDHISRKQNEQCIQQECKRKGFPSYLDVIRENKTEIISYLMTKKYNDLVQFRDFKDRSLLQIAIAFGANDSAISFIENGMHLDIPSEENVKDLREHAQHLGKTKVVEVIDHATWKGRYETAIDKVDHVERLEEENRMEEQIFILKENPEVEKKWWKRRFVTASSKDDHVERLGKENRNEEVMFILKEYPEVEVGWERRYKNASNKDDHVGRLMKENRNEEVTFILKEYPELKDNWKRQYDTAHDKFDHVKEIIRKNRNEELEHILTCFPEIIGLKGVFHKPPLHVAAWENNMVAMKMLISHGADVYEVDSLYDHNILHHIVLHGYDDSLDCLKYLVTKYNELARGKTKYLGDTPIDYAQENNKHNMVKVLQNVSSE